MEDSFEKYIREHRMAFDDAEPSAKHAQDFQRKLEGKKSQSSLNIVWWSAAAVVALIIGFTSVMSTFSSADPAQLPTSMALSDVSSSMAEVEAFYSEEINQSKDILAELSDDAGKAKTLNESLFTLEKQYDFLKSELAIHQGDQRIIMRMIENYRLRLKILEKHLIQIQKYQKTNKSSHNENA